MAANDRAVEGECWRWQADYKSCIPHDSPASPPGATAVAVAETAVQQGPTRMQLLTRADITHLRGCRLMEGPPHRRSQFSHVVFLLQLGFCACEKEVALREFGLRSVEWH